MIRFVLTSRVCSFNDDLLLAAFRNVACAVLACVDTANSWRCSPFLSEDFKAMQPLAGQRSHSFVFQNQGRLRILTDIIVLSLQRLFPFCIQYTIPWQGNCCSPFSSRMLNKLLQTPIITLLFSFTPNLNASSLFR